jgi:hypothetical protein
MSNLIFDKMFRDKINTISWIIFIIGLVSVFYPLYLFFLDTFKDCAGENKAQIEKNWNVDYDEIRVFFLNEYDRANPITKEEGLKEYMDFMKRTLR